MFLTKLPASIDGPNYVKFSTVSCHLANCLHTEMSRKQLNQFDEFLEFYWIDTIFNFSIV